LQGRRTAVELELLPPSQTNPIREDEAAAATAELQERAAKAARRITLRESASRIGILKKEVRAALDRALEVEWQNNRIVATSTHLESVRQSHE